MLRMNVYLITYFSLVALDDPAEARWIEPEISKIVSPMAALPLIRTVHTYIDTVHTSTRLYMQMKRFKVSDKQLWYMKIQAMSTKGTSHSFKTAFTIHTFFTYIHGVLLTGEWQMLSKFANEKKSPVGYRAFAAACIKFVFVYVYMYVF
jgi:hypothetical protein